MFLNITGGITVDDPAIDLGVVMAILSSNEDLPIDKTSCFAAEIGLGGEIRPVQRIDQRILEAEKLGFETYLFPNTIKYIKNTVIKIETVAKVEEVISIVFG